MKILLISAIIMLTACGGAETKSGAIDIRAEICSPLLTQCRFNGGSDGCLQKKQKQTPEQALNDELLYNAFMCADLLKQS